METLGVWLRQTREAKGSTLEEAEIATCIRPRFLEALEASDFSAFPGGEVQVRGFLRIYARYLDLSPDEVLARYDTEKHGAQVVSSGAPAETHPAPPHKAGARDGTQLNIESVLKGLGVEKIVHINSYDVMPNIRLMKDALDYKGLSVVISHQECALYHFRNYRHAGGKIVPFYIDTDVCKNAYNCIKDFMCPAISINEETGQSQIAPDICVGCGVCARICGFKAIKSTATLKGGEN